MVGAAVPAAAQFTPYTEVAGYTVAQIDASGVCFAATQLTSQANRDMVYTYYQAQAGQRWHVAGYQDASALESATVAVTVSVDGTQALSRETETREGDFMLPFEALAEIEGLEALIPDGNTLEIAVGDADVLRVPLDDYCAALGAITACLSTL